MPAASPTQLPFETASWSRRILALAVDWLACMGVTILIVGWRRYWEPGSPEQWITLVLFVLESTVFTSVMGGSFGKLLTRLRTIRKDNDPRPLDPLRALARQIMVAVVVPPLIFKPDGRGLHDLAAGTATVTLTEYRRLRGLD